MRRLGVGGLFSDVRDRMLQYIRNEPKIEGGEMIYPTKLALMGTHGIPILLFLSNPSITG
jgi:hypothetical protein